MVEVNVYFNKLGTTEYNNIVIPDILKRIVVSNNVQKSNLFELYEVNEGESPESISYNYYGIVDYYWTILLTNNIKSRYFDWPMGSQEINQYVISKYGNKSALFFLESSFSNVFNFCDTKYVAKGAKIYKVLECDRNLNKLEIEKVSDTELAKNNFVSLLDSDYNIYSTIKIDRLVYENETSLHHFEDAIKDPTDPTSLLNTHQLLEQYINGKSPASSVTNIEYEIARNDSKRKIYLIKKDYIRNFVNEFKLLTQ